MIVPSPPATYFPDLERNAIAETVIFFAFLDEDWRPLIWREGPMPKVGWRRWKRLRVLLSPTRWIHVTEAEEGEREGGGKGGGVVSIEGVSREQGEDEGLG